MKKIGLLYVLLFVGFADSFSQVPSYVDTNGLVGWWPLDVNARDYSVSSNNFTSYGVNFDSTRYNLCNPVARFSQDSTCSSRLEANLSRSNFTNKLSISFWFKSSWSGCQKGGGVRYVAMGSVGYPTGIQIIESNTVTPYVDVLHSGRLTSVNYRFHPSSLTDWNHLVYSLDSDSARYYLNGNKVGSLVNDLDTFSIGGTTVIGMLGMNFLLHGGYDGLIDELGIWNRALTQAEVNRLFNSQLNSNQSIFPQDTITSCGQDSVLLDAGAGFVSYNWSNGDSTQMTYAKATGMYSVQVADSNGCSAEDSVFVSIINGKILQNDTTICKGDSVSLNVSSIIGTYRASQVFCNGTPTAVVDVTNPITGRTWMDRNLGATRAAISSTDTLAYGDLYQWGRGSDGHQCRTSSTTAILSSTDQPGHRDFIVTSNSPYDWRSPENTNLWQGLNGENNPCPNGYRIPTETELDNERLSWGSNNSVGAYNSLLKMPLSGYRNPSNGTFNLSVAGRYWGNTFYSGRSSTLSFYPLTSSISITNWRADGSSVRCIKEIPSVIGSVFNVNSYQWSTGDTTSTISVLPDSTTTYYVTISNGIHSCVDSVTVTVNNPKVQFAQDTIKSCNQDSLLLDAGAGFSSYNWSNGDSTQITYAKVTGMYSVQVSDSNGCSAEDSVFVNFINRNYDTVLIDQFTMTFSSFYSHSTPSLHIDSTYLVKVNGRYGYADGWSHNDAAYNYAWDTLTNRKVRCNGTQDAQKSTAWLLNGSNIAFRPINDIDNNCCFCSGGNKEYVWKFQNYSGVQVFSFVDGGYGDNSGSLDFKVYVLRSSPIFSHVDTVMSCNSFVWQNGTTYNSTGVYSDTLTTSQGCDSIVSLNLTINTLAYQLPQDTITSCGQDSVLLDAGAGFVSYNWSNGDSTQMTYAKATGMYSVQVADTNGCSAEDSVFVSIINGNILQNDTTICKGDSVSLSVSSIIGTYRASQVFCNGTPTAVVDVTNPVTGRTWMDRNMGASRAAISSTDTAAYGDLYQWGRGSDGHQCRTSSTTTILSSSDQPNHGDFILVTSLPENWRSPTNNNLWQGMNGVNNPCPNGYRIPNSSELNAERMSWSSNNSLGAFNSPLKLTDGGVRSVFTGGFNDVGVGGNYWSSTIYNNNQITRLDYLPTQASLINNTRGYGMSVRCIKEIPSVIGSVLNVNSYQWSTGDTTSTISVSPDSTTTYYVTISNGIHSCVDSVTVTVNNPQFQFAQDSVSGCDTVSVNAGSGWSAYSWSSGDTTQSVSFTTTGLKVLTVTDSIGCAATDSIYVTVNTFVTSTIADTSCDQYTWSQTGITYGSSGTYRDTVPTVVGCDSIIELVLTIHVSDTVRIPTTACDSFTWSQTGLTYYTSGVYSDSLLNNQGCDSILLLDLTITLTTNSIVSISACDSFTWLLNGMTYNASGVYSDTITNSQGCDSIVSLNLTINTLSYQLPQDTITSCGQDSVLLDAGAGFVSYNWSNGDSTQTTFAKATGMYSVQVTDTNGCSAEDSVFVSIINDSILQNDTIICKGDSVSLSITITSAISDQWSLIIPTTSYDTSLLNFSYTGYDRTRNYIYSVYKRGGVQKIQRFELNTNSVTVLNPTGNSRSDVNTFAYDNTSNRIVGARAGRENISALNLSALSWGNGGNGTSDAQSYGGSYFWNPVTQKTSFFGGYGFFYVKNWVWENNGSNWSNPFTNNSSCGSVVPPKRTSHKLALSSINSNEIFIFSGQGSCSGQQTASSCSLGSAWATDVGIYCWLKDIWKYNMTTSTFSNVLPVNSSSVSKEGVFTFDYTNNTFYIIGGYTPSPTYNRSFGSVTNFENGVLRYRQGIDPGFIPISTTGTPPPVVKINDLGSNAAYYDAINKQLVWARKDGIFALSLEGGELLTYQWSTGDTTSTISVSPDSTTTYYVTISNGIHSCVDSVTVTVNNPQFQFAQDSVSGCDTVSVNAGSGWSAYSWSSGDTTQSVSFTTTGLKVLTVTDSIGCTATDSIYVTVNTYVATTISDTSCDQYTWSQTGITYGSSGTYRDTVPTVVGCDSIIELVLTITNSSFSSDTVVACESYLWTQTGVTYFTTGIYFDTMVNAVGCDSIEALDLTIHYSTSSVVNQTACDSFSWPQTGLTYFVSGTYSDTLLNSNGCDSVVFLNLLVYPTITPIIGAVQNMCENDPVFNISSSPVGGVWSGPGVSPTGSFDPTVSGVGVHTIVYTAAGQCANSDTVTIEVFEVPLVDDRISDDECDEGKGSIELTISGGTPPYSYLWSNGKTSKDNLRLKEGTYSLTVTDSNGCIENYIGSLLNLEDDSCDDTYLFVPNVFSPDGNGVNDVLFVDGKNILAVNLQIYNRWGNLVFESNSLTKGWDGIYQGKPVNQGVFVYLVTGRYKDGEEFEQKGTITVVR